MLQRFKVQFGLLSALGDVDVACLIRARRHIIGRNVGDGGKGIAQVCAQFFGLGFQGGEGAFDVGNFGLQSLRFRFVALAHGSANGLCRRICGGLEVFGTADCGARLFVNGQQSCGLGGQATTGEARIKAFGVFADQSNIMHICAMACVLWLAKGKEKGRCRVARQRPLGCQTTALRYADTTLKLMSPFWRPVPAQ